MNERVFTISEASQFLRIGRSRLYELLAAGEIRALHLGRRTIITGQEIDRYLNDLPAYGNPKKNIKVSSSAAA